MTCPDCNGRGEDMAHLHYANGIGKTAMVKCFRCKGSGQVSDEMAHWIMRGRAMRDKRLNGTPCRSLGEEAKRRGISVVLLSKMEMGKVEPVE